jgi:hypothetical protein
LNNTIAVSEDLLIQLNKTLTMQNLVNLCIEKLSDRLDAAIVTFVNDVEFSFGTNSTPPCKYCGNGIIEPSLGEQCDNGAWNKEQQFCNTSCIVSQLNCCAFNQSKTIPSPFQIDPNPSRDYRQICVDRFDSNLILYDDVEFTFGLQKPDCSLFVGGCCRQNGLCTDNENRESCQDPLSVNPGYYLGNGTKCSKNLICSQQIGACCVTKAITNINYCIDNILMVGCQNKFGAFQMGKNCTQANCPTNAPTPAPTPLSTTITTITTIAPTTTVEETTVTTTFFPTTTTTTLAPTTTTAPVCGICPIVPGMLDVMIQDCAVRNGICGQDNRCNVIINEQTRACSLKGMFYLYFYR